MPVRTRSQIKRERTRSTTSAQDDDPTPTPITTRRRSARLSKKNSKTQQNEMKQQSKDITPLLSQSTEGEDQTTSNIYKRNTQEFRQFVQEYLDTPNKSIKKPVHTPITPSGLHRINIKDNGQEYDFYIPPKVTKDPVEIREEIRATLASTESLSPKRVPIIRNDSHEKSLSPQYNQQTHLWSPVTPTYDKQNAEQVSKWLIGLIVSILLAIFISYYHQDILVFAQKQIKPMGQIWESISSFISSLISSANGEYNDSDNDNVNVHDNSDVTKS